MEQRGVGEYTIEIVIRQIELEKILLPDFTTAVGTRHVDEMRGAFQTDRDVTESGNHFEVSPGPAAKIKYCETRLTLDVLQHRRDVLADIVPRAGFEPATNRLTAGSCKAPAGLITSDLVSAGAESIAVEGHHYPLRGGTPM